MSVLFLRNAQDNKHLPSFLFRGNLSKNSLLISLEHTSSDDETHTHLSEEEKRKLCPCVFVHSRLMTNRFFERRRNTLPRIKLRHSPNIFRSTAKVKIRCDARRRLIIILNVLFDQSRAFCGCIRTTRDPIFQNHPLSIVRFHEL